MNRKTSKIENKFAALLRNTRKDSEKFGEIGFAIR